MTTRSTSLPRLEHIRYSKYDDFFSNCKFRSQAKELAMDEDPEDAKIKNPKKVQPITHKALKNSIQNVHQLSDLRSKAEQFLNNNHKMGVLDNEKSKNKVIMTRINEAIFMPVTTEEEQLKSYLTSLKSQLNYYYNKSNTKEKEINNMNSLKVQIREKIILYEQLISESAEDKTSLLLERQDKIRRCKYEMLILQNMKQRSKEINNLMKKRVLTAQAEFKMVEHHHHISNELEGIRQDELDYKVYLCREYAGLEDKKTTTLNEKKEQANYNIEQNRASELLRKHHESISIMQRDDYELEVHCNTQNKFKRNVATQKVCQVILQKRWERENNKFKDIDINEQHMKMYSLSKNFVLPQSYYQSFQLSETLHDEIAKKEEKMEELKERKKELQKIWDELKFKEIEEEEKLYKHIKKETSPEELSLIEENKNIMNRQVRVQQRKQILNELKLWIRRQETMIKLSVSKKSKAEEHIIKILECISNELKQLMEMKAGKEDITLQNHKQTTSSIYTSTSLICPKPSISNNIPQYFIKNSQ